MDCNKLCSDRKIVFQDGAGKSKMYFNNPNQYTVQRIIVDDCLIKEGKRCDFLLIDHKSVEYYIELKGKQIEEACLQISKTIEKISKNMQALKYAFVVSSACPLMTSKIQVNKANFKKKYNTKLHIKNKHCEYLLKD
jgi:hypothetical protein